MNQPAKAIRNPLRQRVAFASAVLLVAFGSPAADAPPANVTVAGSTITATFKQEGVPVDTMFKQFSGRIVYDPKNVANASASLEVLMASFDMGDDAYNAEVKKKQWFDSANYPKATFRSTSVKASGPNRFDATGALTLKGKVLTITVPVTVKTTPAGSAFDGNFSISRKAFGLGDPIWEDVLEDRVDIKFHLISTGR